MGNALAAPNPHKEHSQALSLVQVDGLASPSAAADEGPASPKMAWVGGLATSTEAKVDGLASPSVAEDDGPASPNVAEVDGLASH